MHIGCLFLSSMLMCFKYLSDTLPSPPFSNGIYFSSSWLSPAKNTTFPTSALPRQPLYHVREYLWQAFHLSICLAFPGPVRHSFPANSCSLLSPSLPVKQMSPRPPFLPALAGQNNNWRDKTTWQSFSYHFKQCRFSNKQYKPRPVRILYNF